MKRKKTYSLTETVISAIEKAYESNVNKKVADNRNSIVQKCIIRGLKEIYNIEV
jgi:hypothetical protein